MTGAAASVQDAMETAAQSGEAEIAEELLHFFVDNGERECFAALLYTCYELIKPDVALEVSEVAVRYRLRVSMLIDCVSLPSV